MTQSYTLSKSLKYPTIFKMDDWGINSIDRGEYAFIKIDSIIVHNCSHVNSTDQTWTPDPFIITQEYNLHHICKYCGTSCPPEIQALWRLQNMEKL